MDLDDEELKWTKLLNDINNQLKEIKIDLANLKLYDHYIDLTNKDIKVTQEKEK